MSSGGIPPYSSGDPLGFPQKGNFLNDSLVQKRNTVHTIFSNSVNPPPGHTPPPPANKPQASVIVPPPSPPSPVFPSDSFEREIEAWKDSFERLFLNNKNNQDTHKEIFDFLKRLHILREEFGGRSESGSSHSLVDYWDAAYHLVKSTRPIGHAALDATEWFKLDQARKELENICKKYQKPVDHQISALFKKVEEEQKNALNSGTDHLVKLAASQIIPLKLATFAGLAENTAYKCCKLAGDLHKNCMNVGKIWRHFQLQKNWINHLQPLSANADTIKAHLSQKKEAFQGQMNVAMNKLAPLFANCARLNFEEIKVELKSHHINLDVLSERGPTNKEEWDAQIVNLEFKILLCKQWVEHQETVNRLVEQGSRTILLAKNDVERKLLIYRGIEQILGIVLIGFRIVSYFPKIQTLLAPYTSNPFFKMSIPGLTLLETFISNFTLTLDSILLIILNHCIGYYYKPHEYGIEGYKASLLLQGSKKLDKLRYFYHVLKVIFLTIRIQVIEKRILRLQQDESKINDRYQALKDHSNANLRESKNYQSRLKQQIEGLKLKDLDYALAKGKKDLNAAGNLIEGIKSLDPDYMSPTTRNFLQQHLGITLEQGPSLSPELLERQIKSFLVKKENKFLSAYSYNRRRVLA